MVEALLSSYGGYGVLCAAIAALWVWFRQSYKRIEKRLTERENQVTDLMRQIIALGRRVGILAGVSKCPLHGCPWRLAVVEAIKPNPHGA